MKKPIFFSLIITVAMLSLIISCADRLDTYDIIQTTTTEQKLDNDAGTATAIAERKVSMDATAAAERGESIQMEDLDRVELTDNLPAEIPSDISPSSETITVQILNEGYYEPEVVVVKVGTSVVWENTQRTPYGILSDEGQDEVFNSGGLRRKLGAKENPTYEYTFTKVGRFTYGPDLSGAAMVAKGRGVIFVVE